MTDNSAQETNDNETHDHRRCDEGLRVNWFERVTSMLTALVLLLGTVVLLLGLVWLISPSDSQQSHPPQPEKIVRGTVNPQGVERDFLEPGAEETADLNEPSMQDRLQAVTDAVSRVAGSETVSLVRQDGAAGQQHLGDSRPPGPESEHDIVPRFQRWQLEFTARNIDSYAGQLDHYGIELGAVGGSIQGVDYASDLSTQPATRRGASGQETRLYMMWTRPSPLMQFDRRLLMRAGVPVDDRQILKFISSELENQLVKMELEYARAHGPSGHQSLESIAKTVFTSTAVGDGYRFVVSEQRYRKH